jgi:tetratricopeptide (TPR) repeat protein
MTRLARPAVASWTMAMILSIWTPSSAQESLADARQLYASADYRNALTMLNALLAASPSPQERQSIELYRTLCLVAIGNTDEANKAIEAMVAHDPLYRPNMEEVPPRLRTVFSDARKRLLPSLIQERYVIAKAAFDRGEMKLAADGFTQVLMALADPDIAPAAKQPPLSDLRVLAAGFNDLTVRALAPPPVPVVPVTVQAPPPPVPAAPREPIVYSADNRNVVPPETVRQDIPAYPGRVMFDRSGVIEVVIDANGSVESASMLEAMEPLYNRVLLAAAKNWQYRPARLDGMTPVKYRKRIQVSLTRPPDGQLPREQQ